MARDWRKEQKQHGWSDETLREYRKAYSKYMDRVIRAEKAVLNAKGLSKVIDKQELIDQLSHNRVRLGQKSIDKVLDKARSLSEEFRELQGSARLRSQHPNYTQAQTEAFQSYQRAVIRGETQASYERWLSVNLSEDVSRRSDWKPEYRSNKHALAWFYSKSK